MVVLTELFFRNYVHKDLKIKARHLHLESYGTMVWNDWQEGEVRPRLIYTGERIRCFQYRCVPTSVRLFVMDRVRFTFAYISTSFVSSVSYRLVTP